MSSFRDDPNFLFELVLPGCNRGDRNIRVRCFENPTRYPHSGPCWGVDLEVRQGGRTIFARGELWGGVNKSHSIDGKHAREHALAILETKPGDTDADYFKSYKPEQLAWVAEHGDHVRCERERRYCDEDGNVRGRR
jgi:hypothetical protein